MYQCRPVFSVAVCCLCEDRCSGVSICNFHDRLTTVCGMKYARYGYRLCRIFIYVLLKNPQSLTIGFLNTAQQISLFNAHIWKEGIVNGCPCWRRRAVLCVWEKCRVEGPLYCMLWCEDRTLSFNIKIKVEKVTRTSLWGRSEVFSLLQNDALHLEYGSIFVVEFAVNLEGVITSSFLTSVWLLVIQMCD